MKLREWIDKRAVGRKRIDVMHEIRTRALDLGVKISITTLSNVDRGATLGNVQRALAIEKATGGEVTLRELVE